MPFPKRSVFAVFTELPKKIIFTKSLEGGIDVDILMHVSCFIAILLLMALLHATHIMQRPSQLGPTVVEKAREENDHGELLEENLAKTRILGRPWG